MPFKQQRPNMLINRTIPENWLNSLRKWLQRDDQVLRRYQEGVEYLLDRWYAQRVPEKIISNYSGDVRYLPHHRRVQWKQAR
jgi:hypothetical protein